VVQEDAAIRVKKANKCPHCGLGGSVPAVKKARIDAVLAERGLFPSRSAAAGAVRAGEVRVGRDGPVALRPSQLVEPEATLVVDPGPPYVSRGGIKLENALETLAIDVAGRDCLDVGASTGGFTDCLLQRGAARVVAVDVAYGQLDLRMREDPRVTVIERLNARALTPGDLPFAPSLALVDVSFISLTKILPAVASCLAPGGEVLAMVKPQFELGKERVGRGVVREDADRHEAIRRVAEAATELGLTVRGFASSGLPGPKGNRETFVWCGGEGPAVADFEAAIAAAEAAAPSETAPAGPESAEGAE
jgi:23S rRNA (cytidine1920-2'-O)/16S rRNA (cytidine1409-2'-O)-methyltransferase